MSNLGPKWQDNEDYSPARMDAKTILRDTGTNIVAMASTRQLGAVCPTDTSAGLVKDVLYISQYDGFLSRTAFIPVFRKHTHSADTDEEGGRCMDMLMANTAECFEINMFHMNLADWKIDTVGTGGGFIYDESTTSGRIKVSTGGVSGNCKTGSIGGGTISFADMISWQAKMEVSHNTSLLVRVGVNVDRVDETQNTTRRQCGIEACDGHGINWVIINANYKILNTPSNECRLYVDGVSTGVSTVNVAFGGSSDGLRLVRMGIKAVSANDRWLYLYIMKLLANPGSADLF
jgi:hypothetical protein